MNMERKRRGCFCWCCGRYRANECFSGRGRARHLCNHCAKLGEEELVYRQALIDIDRMLDWNGVVRRAQRARFASMLSHPDERVRRYAREVSRNGCSHATETRT